MTLIPPFTDILDRLLLLVTNLLGLLLGRLVIKLLLILPVWDQLAFLVGLLAYFQSRWLLFLVILLCMLVLLVFILLLFLLVIGLVFQLVFEVQVGITKGLLFLVILAGIN